MGSGQVDVVRFDAGIGRSVGVGMSQGGVAVWGRSAIGGLKSAAQRSSAKENCGEAVPGLRGSGKPVFRSAMSGCVGELGIWMLACILAARDRLRWRTCQSWMRAGSEFMRWWYLL